MKHIYYYPHSKNLVFYAVFSMSGDAESRVYMTYENMEQVNANVFNAAQNVLA